jgi:uncharacterized protein YciI
MQGFVFKLIPPRPTFAHDLNDAARAIMQQHAGYWAELTKQGRTVAYGPVDDPSGSYGLGVILAVDQAEAEGLLAQDPAVLSSHGFRADLAPMLALITPTARYEAS